MLPFDSVKQFITGRTELSCGTFVRIVKDGKTTWHGLTGAGVNPHQPPTWISREQLEKHCKPETW